MQRNKYLFGLALIALCVVGFGFLDQPEENGAPDFKVTESLAAERATKKSDQKTGAVAVPKPVITSAAKIQTVVEPKITYSPSIIPKNMTVQEKKQRFMALMLPAINQVYQELDQRYQEVTTAMKTGADSERIEKFKIEYRAETDEELLVALKPHPRSIALAQAAMESAWGTSRFFIQANNVFGVWSFDKNEPRIAAGKQRGNKTIWIKKYSSIYASVKDNYRILARGNAFKKFRALRMKTSNPYELVKKLDRYSEKGDEYGKELASMISFNKFDKYDRTFWKRKK